MITALSAPLSPVATTFAVSSPDADSVVEVEVSELMSDVDELEELPTEFEVDVDSEDEVEELLD